MTTSNWPPPDSDAPCIVLLPDGMVLAYEAKPADWPATNRNVVLAPFVEALPKVCADVALRRGTHG